MGNETSCGQIGNPGETAHFTPNTHTPTPTQTTDS